MKQRIVYLFNWFVVVSLFLAALAPLPVLAAPPVQEIACAEEYIVQADDWLSKISEKLLGNVLAFPAIAEATNQKHAGDTSFAQITNPDLIEVGWKLCVPGAEDAQALLGAAVLEATLAPLEPANLNIFAAASLTEAFNEIGQNFSTEHPGVTFIFNFAGSQQLAQQLGQGAPADVFASANKTQMNVAIEAGRVVSGTERTFVRNRLVVIYPTDNPAGITQLQDLTEPGVKVILAAKEVPVGQYSLDFLNKAITDTAFSPTYRDDVLKNVVSYEENVRAVLTKIVLGEGDVGIVYTSDITGEEADKVGRLDIPDNLNTIASYPIAVVSDSAYSTQAQAFVDYVLSPAAQEILVKYGFIPTTGSATGGPPVAGPLSVTGLVANPMTWSVADISQLPQIEIKATDRDGVEQTYQGVLMSELLNQVGVESNATEVVFTGGDGYSQSVSLADLQACADCIIAVLEDGSLRNIQPAMLPRYWVKGLVQMEIK